MAVPTLHMASSVAFQARISSSLVWLQLGRTNCDRVLVGLLGAGEPIRQVRCALLHQKEMLHTHA